MASNFSHQILHLYHSLMQLSTFLTFLWRILAHTPKLHFHYPPAMAIVGYLSTRGHQRIRTIGYIRFHPCCKKFKFLSL